MVIHGNKKYISGITFYFFLAFSVSGIKLFGSWVWLTWRSQKGLGVKINHTEKDTQPRQTQRRVRSDEAACPICPGLTKTLAC